MAPRNQIETFSSSVPCDETIKPVWRGEVRYVVCWGRGCNNWATLEHRDSRVAATPPTPRARLLLSQWHRRQFSLHLTPAMRSYPTIIRKPHLPASPRPLPSREMEFPPMPLSRFTRTKGAVHSIGKAAGFYPG